MTLRLPELAAEAGPALARAASAAVAGVCARAHQDPVHSRSCLASSSLMLAPDRSQPTCPVGRRRRECRCGGAARTQAAIWTAMMVPRWITIVVLGSWMSANQLPQSSRRYYTYCTCAPTLVKLKNCALRSLSSMSRMSHSTFMPSSRMRHMMRGSLHAHVKAVAVHDVESGKRDIDRCLCSESGIMVKC